MSKRSPSRGSGFATDERVVHQLRTHSKALIGPALVALMITVVAVAAGFVVPGQYRDPTWIGGVVVCVLAWLWFLGGPYLKWHSTIYTVTDRRIITRRGVLNQTGHDIQLRKVNAVAYERSLSDRILGCGTLKLDTASEAGEIVLPDVPRVEEVHRDINELLHDAPLDHD